MDCTSVVVFSFLIAYVAAQGCGISSYSSGRVIGGSNAPHGAWPWQILLLDSGRPGCGGSIIGPNHVITAAHCVVDQRSGMVKSASVFTVRVGDNSMLRRDQEEQDYRVLRVISHPQFNFNTFVSDVAILVLSSPIRFGQYVKPVCMPTRPPVVGHNCVITGFGRVSRYVQDMHHQLQQAQMPVVDPTRCSYAMRAVGPFPIGPHSVCSGNGQTTVSGCQGDSGGPFVCQNNGRWELVGAVSWGSQDCSSRPNEFTVYANIYNLSGWLRQYIPGI